MEHHTHLGMTGLGGYTMLPNMAATNFQPIFADATGLTWRIFSLFFYFVRTSNYKLIR